VPFSSLLVEEESRSRDGTVKALFRTPDGHPIEAVLMRYRDGRRSVCVSSQSGCPLTCSFCATGAMRFGRNLKPWEILDQVLHFRRLEPVDHLVFMGMGEPLLNLDAVLAAARRLPDVGITHRRTTLSTVGWLPALRRFVEDPEKRAVWSSVVGIISYVNLPIVWFSVKWWRSLHQVQSTPKTVDPDMTLALRVNAWASLILLTLFLLHRYRIALATREAEVALPEALPMDAPAPRDSRASEVA